MNESISYQDAIAQFGQVGSGLALAKQYATQLQDVVKQQNLCVKIQNKDYLLVEAWLFLGASVGLMPRTETVNEIRQNGMGELEGFEATVEAIRVATGEVVSRAMSRCYLGEKGMQDKFAVFSKAQTRATSKAMSQALRWIVVLAGYSGTPYDEVTEDMEQGRPKQEPEPEVELGTLEWQGTIHEIKHKKGTSSKGRGWTKYFLINEDGESFQTFDKAHVDKMKEIGKGNPAIIRYKQTKYGNEIEEIVKPGDAQLELQG